MHRRILVSHPCPVTLGGVHLESVLDVIVLDLHLRNHVVNLAVGLCKVTRGIVSFLFQKIFNPKCNVLQLAFIELYAITSRREKQNHTCSTWVWYLSRSASSSIFAAWMRAYVVIVVVVVCCR